MQKKDLKPEPISIRFILSVLAILLVLIFYISYPGDLAKKKEKQSFEEMLEYNTQYQKEVYNTNNTTENDKDNKKEKAGKNRDFEPSY